MRTRSPSGSEVRDLFWAVQGPKGEHLRAYWVDRSPSVTDAWLPRLLLGGVALKGTVEDGEVLEWEPAEALKPLQDPRTAEPGISRARLIRWIPEKGFGFARVDGTPGDVFVHGKERVSAVETGGPKPVKVGDTLLGVVAPGARGKGPQLQDWCVMRTRAELEALVAPQVAAFLARVEDTLAKGALKEEMLAAWARISSPEEGSTEARSERLARWSKEAGIPATVLLRQVFNRWARDWDLPRPARFGRSIAQAMLLGWAPLDVEGDEPSGWQPGIAMVRDLERVLEEGGPSLPQNLAKLGFAIPQEPAAPAAETPWTSVIPQVAGAIWERKSFDTYEYLSDDERGTRSHDSVSGSWTLTLSDGSKRVIPAGGTPEVAERFVRCARACIERETRVHGWTVATTAAHARLDEIEAAPPARRSWVERIAGCGVLPGKAADALEARIQEHVALASKGATPEATWEPEALAVVAEPLLRKLSRQQDRLCRIPAADRDVLEAFGPPSVLDGDRHAHREAWRKLLEEAPAILDRNEAALARFGAQAEARARLADETARAEAKARAEAANKELADRAAQLSQDAQELPWLLDGVSTETVEKATGLTPGEGIGPRDPRDNSRSLPGNGQVFATELSLSGARWGWEITWTGDVSTLEGWDAPTGFRKRTATIIVRVQPGWRMVATQTRDGQKMAVKVADASGHYEGPCEGPTEDGGCWAAWSWEGKALGAKEARDLLTRAGVLKAAPAPLPRPPVTAAPSASQSPASMGDLMARFGKKR